MKHSSWIEIDKSALKKNFKYLNKRLGKEVKFVSVIKGNAYGHGIEEFVPLAEDNGIDYFAVFDAWEAERVQRVINNKSNIMIMGSINQDELDWAIESGISFFVFEQLRLKQAIISARKLKKKAKIHIELETGLFRTGFEEEELQLVIALIKDNIQYIELEGFCSHLAGAESISNYLRIQNQMEKFKELISMFSDRGLIARYNHIACSAAALTYPQSIFNLVRVGIAQYGYWPSMETKMYNLLSNENKFTRDPLQRIISWKSRVMSVKTIKPGSFISYGSSYLTLKTTKIATVPVGYYHGYRRSLSNTGQVLIRGHKVNVVGTVNMNIFQVDVTNIQNVEIGDEVVIIGKQGKNKISVASFSELSNQVNYEFLTRLPKSIPRIIIDKTNNNR